MLEHHTAKSSPVEVRMTKAIIRTCRECGKPESENRRRLDVHHIVPRRECLSPEIANHPDNLVSLCSECHMRIEWEGGQKRGTRRRGKVCKRAA